MPDTIKKITFSLTAPGKIAIFQKFQLILSCTHRDLLRANFTFFPCFLIRDVNTKNIEPLGVSKTVNKHHQREALWDGVAATVYSIQSTARDRGLKITVPLWLLIRCF